MIKNTKQKSFSHLQINPNDEECSKTSRPLPGNSDNIKKTESSEALQRLLTKLSEEQQRTQHMVSLLQKKTLETPVTESDAEGLVVDNRGSSSVFKGKYEVFQPLFVSIQEKVRTLSVTNEALERQNKMLEARLEQECRANAALREQMDILTTYTESLFSDDDLPLDDVVTTSTERKKSVTALNTPPASFKPLSPKKNVLLDSFQPKVASTTTTTNTCTKSSLDEMLITQAEELVTKNQTPLKPSSFQNPSAPLLAALNYNNDPRTTQAFIPNGFAVPGTAYQPPPPPPLALSKNNSANTLIYSPNAANSMTGGPPIVRRPSGGDLPFNNTGTSNEVFKTR